MTELLDTAPLRDQRTMVYVTEVGSAHETPADVEAAWQRWADEQGLPIRRRQGDWSTTLKQSRKTIQVYISGGKWIADCPGCNGGVAGWPGHERGCCLDCGTIYQLAYPSPEECHELARLMQPRPVGQRNYFCHQGETIDNVRRENAVWQFAEDSDSRIVRVQDLKGILSTGELERLKKAGVI